MVIKLQPNAHLLFIIFLALISGGVIALASSLKPIWWAAWLGPALLIVTALSAPEKWRRAIIMFAALVAGLSILPSPETSIRPGFAVENCPTRFIG